MSDRTEHELVLSQFLGVNLLVDETKLGPAYLRRAQNWIPGETLRLEKRPGTSPHPGDATALANVTRIHALFATRYGSTRYLYLVGANAGVDTIYVSTNDGAWAAATGGTFASDSETYGFEQSNDVVYVSNGIDVPKRILLASDPTTAVDLVAVASFTDGATAASLTADVGAGILSGTYAYCWAIFDHTDGLWLERSQTREITKRSNGDESISFPLPTGFATNGGATSSRYRAHLFVGPVNFPIEFAHDQTPEGVQASASILRQIVIDGMPVPLRAAVRRGRTMRAYFGRLVLAADTTTPHAVWCTHTLAPGLEQDLFNAGLFFPHNGRLPRTPSDVTGIAVAATGERGSNTLKGPLVVTTLDRTFLNFGDFLDDPNQDFTQVSARAGCVGPDAMTETPFGVCYLGTETVWIVPTGGGLPMDIGWPIRPALKDVPPGSRDRCILRYHKGFLKCWIVPAGSTTAIHQWWLDLRQGLTPIPSWWGPHIGVAASAVAVSQFEPGEPDRAWHAVEGTNVVEIIHQANRWTEHADASTIVAVGQTGELNDRRPFDRKLWKLLRAVGRVESDTSITLSTVIDSADTVPIDAWVFDAGVASMWDITWDITWGQAQFVEAESRYDGERARGRSIALQFSHGDAVGIALREIEIRYELIPRVTRSTSAQGS